MKRERDKAAVVSTTTATFIFGGWRNKDTYEQSIWQIRIVLATKTAIFGFQIWFL